METHSGENECRLLSEIEKRVENMREQAQALQKEKESLLELLQDLQDSDKKQYNDADREDLEYNIERLVIRSLTVEVSVATPRDESQTKAYETVSQIIEDFKIHLEQNPMKHVEVIESMLNASLPEPFSAHVDARFQSKLLGCTAEDQKCFRRKLQMMHRLALKQVCNGSYVDKENKIETDAYGNKSTVNNNATGLETLAKNMTIQ